MKILSVGNFGFGWDGSICDEEHIAGALEQLGHEVIRLQRDNWQGIALPNPDEIDFLLVAQWDSYGDTIDKLRKINGVKKVVYWAFDYQADGQAWHEILVSKADLYLSKRIADSKYKNWQWLSQDFAPPFLDEVYPIKKDIDVLFTGTYLPWADERNKTLKAVDEKFNLVIHSVNPAEWISAGFKNVNGPVMDDQLPALIARAKVNLSIDHTIEAGYWSDRNAQIMCCGAIPLFRYVPLSENTFHDYVAYFYNVQDCLEKIEVLLNAEMTATKNWYQFAQDNLKAVNRVRDLLTIVQAHL